MWSGFNETQWVDWTCSFTRGMVGVGWGWWGTQLQLDSDFLRGEPPLQECDWPFVT